MNLLIRNRLFFLICFCLPFLFVPKVIQLNFIGGPIGSELIVGPIIIAYVYTLYCSRIKLIFVNIKEMKLFLFIYIIALFVSLIHGLYIYPYYDLIFNGPADQIEKLPMVLKFLNYHNIIIEEKILLSIWFVARFLKNIVLEIFYTFGFSYIIYCWFKEDPSVGVRILKKASFIIVEIIIVYSIFEISYFAGYEWAKNVLINVNPFLHAIRENFGWWPPLLWSSPRVRSIFPEPSQFGIYAAFIMPFIWSDILNKKSLILRISMCGLLSLLVFMSLSKTANILLLFEIVLLILFAFIRHKMIFINKCALIIIITGVAFGVNILCLSNYGGKPFNGETSSFNAESKVSGTENQFGHKEGTLEEYLQNNIVGVTNENMGSNGARFAIINNDLRVGKDHCLIGVGSNLKSAYTTYYFTEKELAIREIKKCRQLQYEQGVLKTGYPNVSEFSLRFAENGILGLFIYIVPIIILFFLMFKTKREIFLLFNDFEINTIVCMLISLVGCFVSGGSSVLTTIQSYWILLGLMYAYVLQAYSIK